MNVAPIAFYVASVLAAAPNTIAPPPNWETWPIADNCQSALQVFAARNNKTLANRYLDSTWYYFEGRAKVDARIEDACTYVVLDDNKKVFGWIATDILVTQPPERVAQLAAEKTLRDKRIAEEKARVSYVQSLPTIENGNLAVFIGSDRKCSEQFVQALSMDGLEKRKRIAELVSFGCGYLEDRGVHVKRLEAQATFCRISPAEGKHEGKPGWVPCAWLIK